MPRPNPVYVGTTVYLPKPLHRALKIEAAQRGMTISKIVLEALALRKATDDARRSPPLATV